MTRLPKLLLSRRDVCQVTGFGLTKVTRLIGQGVIPSQMIEGSRVVRLVDLLAWHDALRPNGNGATTSLQNLYLLADDGTTSERVA